MEGEVVKLADPVRWMPLEMSIWQDGRPLLQVSRTGGTKTATVGEVMMLF
jgi:hypothetical protein